MSEERRKSRNRAEILQGASRCIYCENAPESVEHMPPIGMFTRNQRLSGYEFASCLACNSGTRAADALVQFMARLRPFRGAEQDPLFLEARQKVSSLDTLTPGLRDELFDQSKASLKWVRGPKGILEQMVEVRADGPLVAGHLCVFGAKLGMALYREHLKEPLPLDGATFVQPFLNGGLSKQMADRLLKILPGYSTLRQGKLDAGGQFGYRFNCDNRTILAALVEFHSNIFFFVVATSEPDEYRAVLADVTCAEIAPGQFPLALAKTSIVPRLPRVLRE